MQVIQEITPCLRALGLSISGFVKRLADSRGDIRHKRAQIGEAHASHSKDHALFVV